MAGWPQQSNGVFPGMLDASNSSNLLDPSMNSMYNGNNFNSSQFNNQAFQQRMHNGNVPTQNAYQNQTFNVASVIPSKRPRENGMAMSPAPQQNPGLNVSRSQTPMQQPQQGTSFQSNQQGHQFQPPNPYQHLQQNSTNATPSPTMPNQPFRPPQPPQRMSTASPATFSQLPQSMGGQMSPGPAQQHMSPSPQHQHFSPNLSGGQGFGQGLGNPGGVGGIPNNIGGAGMNMSSQMMQQQQQQHQQQQQRQQYQQKLMQQQQRMQANNGVGQRPMAQPGQIFNAQSQQGQATSNQQQQPSAQAGPSQEKMRQFIVGLSAQLQREGRPLNPNPIIQGRQFNIFVVWMSIYTCGGGQRLTAANMWHAAASKLGFQGNMAAAQELRQVWEMYLNTYERQMMVAQQHRKQQQAQISARQMAGLGPTQQGSPTMQNPPSSQDGVQHAFLQPQQQVAQQAATQNQGHVGGQLQRPGGFPTSNGTPALGLTQNTPQQSERQPTPSLKKSESIPPQDQQPDPIVAPDKAPPTTAADVTPTVKREASTSIAKPDQQDIEYKPYKRTLDSYGGYDIDALFKLTSDIYPRIPDVPAVHEMGVIDIRALTLSMQSGIHGEVRHAIDSIVQLSCDQRIMLELDKCEDMVDALVDCAEDQLDILSESSVHASDAIGLPSYEEVVRSSRAEAESLQDIPEVDSVEYQAERAADRMIGLTTILRNLSFIEHNHPYLSSDRLFSFLSNCIRQIGTRKMFLRRSATTADFYKDMVTFLSNIAHTMELSSRDSALHILHFLLAFSPQPAPTFTSKATLRFHPYAPLVHRYLPLAVDSLAKIFARQEPNRALYRSVFSSASSLSGPSSTHDLLTRAFALSISVLPDRSKGSLSTHAELRVVEARKAVLTQGMLAADILASLIAETTSSSEPPDHVINLARAWLESEDRWAAGLLRMAYVLSTDQNRSSAQNAASGQRRQSITRIGPDGRMQMVEADSQGYGFIVHRGLGMLKRLIEEAARGPRAKSSRGSANTCGATQANEASADNKDNTGDAHADNAGRDSEAALLSNGHREDDDAFHYDSEEESHKWMIKGDPIPHRETVLGAFVRADADKDSLRLLAKLYEMVVS